jgi:hypothetical protein
MLGDDAATTGWGEPTGGATPTRTKAAAAITRTHPATMKSTLSSPFISNLLSSSPAS